MLESPKLINFKSSPFHFISIPSFHTNIQSNSPNKCEERSRMISMEEESQYGCGKEISEAPISSASSSMKLSNKDCPYCTIKSRGKTMITNLPCEIIHEIFLRMSVASLYGCMSTCKTWYNLVRDSHGDRLPFTHTPFEFMLESNDRKDLFFCEPIDEGNCKMTSFKYGKLNFDKNARDLASGRIRQSFELVNSCKGLICFHGWEKSVNEYDFFVVSNPVTGEYIKTPLFAAGEELQFHSVEKNTTCAFGYSSVSKQYKILRVFIRFTEVDMDKYDNFEYIEERTFKIYTLGEAQAETWRIIKCEPKEMGRIGGAEKCECEQCTSLDFVNSPVTYLHSVAHWLQAEASLIVTFDFNRESFQVIRTPMETSLNFYNCRMGVLKDCLFVSILKENDQFEIWVMKEYGLKDSWTKDLVIELMPHPVNYSTCTPLQYMKSGELVLLQHQQGKVDLLLYNPVNRIFQRIRIPGERNRYGDVVSHTPSVVSLKDIFKLNGVKMINQ